MSDVIEGQEPVEKATTQADAVSAETTQAAAVSQAEKPAEKTYPESVIKEFRANEARQRLRIKELEDANKSEAEKLAERAKQADALEPEVTALRESVAAMVTDLKASLPKELQDLLPEGSPAAQLDWLRKAQKSAATLAPQNVLPNTGGRNPGSAGEAGQRQTEEAILNRLQQEVPALRGRILPT